MKSLHLPFLFLSLATAALVPSAQVGSVLHSVHINEALGGFGGSLQDDDWFATSMTGLGDIDGDGVPDMAASAPLDDDGGPERGAIWILFLNADGSVKAETKISQTQGGFGGTLLDGSLFGYRLANVGDLDGDGISELAASAGGPRRIWVLFLNPDGTVRSERENLFGDPAFVPATMARHFGGGMVGLGDLDGDGLGDLALGAPGDPEVDGPDSGAIWILRLDTDGSYKSAEKITTGRAGFTGVLAGGDHFGGELELLGDLDGDGNRELGVLAKGAPHLGDFWILFLDAAEQVKSAQRYGIDDFGLAWPSHITYGTSDDYAWLGDLDGDGQDEVALGFDFNFPGGPQNEGGLAVATQRADGSVRKALRISHQRAGLGNLTVGTGFGASLALLGDLDGDGNPELAVGAPYDRAAGESTGGIWILTLARTAVRNGSGVNPLILSQASEPTFGTIWSATLDCSGHAPGMAFVFGYSQRASGSFYGAAGEILVGGTQRFLLQVPHVSGPTVLSAGIPPYSLALIDLEVHIQGLCTGAPGFQLSNALDIVIGR